jgi:SPP1 gp7 family putative phage head morphogenesis protein
VAFDLIPEEALKFLREKSLTIAGVEYKELLNEVRDTIVQGIKEGIPFDELKDQVNTLFESYGVTPLNPAHLETVFRTNLFTSYAVGQLEQAQSMADRFPLWRYSAIKDSRTRPDHLALDGEIFRVGEGPVPPIDYNCRCTAIYLHVSQTESVEPTDWEGDPDFVRFTSRKSWEKWRDSKREVLTPDVQQWIDANL